MPVAEKALEVFDPAKLKISHADYAGKTPAEARRAIKTLLDNYNIVIATEKVDKARVQGVIGQNAQGENVAIPDYLQSYGQMEGVALARVFYDGTTNTGAVKAGNAVVIDTVKGNAVTGIHSSWGVDEYKIVGIALENYSTPAVTTKRIQIRLSPPGAIAAEDIAFIRTQAKANPPTPYPTLTPGVASTRRVWPAVKYSNVTYGDGSPGNDGSAGITFVPAQAEPIDVFNIGYGRYVPEFTQLLGWKFKDKWYCEYLPAPMLMGSLTSDLLLTVNSYATISVINPGGVMAPNEKVKNMGSRPGYKYAYGTMVFAALVGTEYVVVKALQCPIPQ